MSRSKYGHLFAGDSFTAVFPVDPVPPLTEQPPQLSQVPHGRARPGLWNQGLGAPGPCTQVLCLPGNVVDKWVPSTQSTPAPLSGILCLDRSTTREQALGPPGIGEGVSSQKWEQDASRAPTHRRPRAPPRRAQGSAGPAPISGHPPVHVCAKLFCPEKAALGRAAQTPASPQGSGSPPAPQLPWEAAAAPTPPSRGLALSPSLAGPL